MLLDFGVQRGPGTARPYTPAENDTRTAPVTFSSPLSGTSGCGSREEPHFLLSRVLQSADTARRDSLPSGGLWVSNAHYRPP